MNNKQILAKYDEVGCFEKPTEFHYTIISSDGKTMKSRKNIKSEETAIINTQEWPSGIYHLIVSKKDGPSTTKK